MNWNFGDTSVVILGAGFSVAATDGKVPLMRNFFDQLDENKFPRLSGFIADVVGPPASANVESVLLSLDQMCTSPAGVLADWASEWKSTSGIIYEELTTYTLGRLSPCEKIREDNWAAGILSNAGPATTVISMNYDTIAERVLSNRLGMRHSTRFPTCPHCKMRRLLESACSCEGRHEITEEDWKGSLIKPHGSVAWKRCLNSECCSYECLVAHPQCVPFEPCDCPYCDTNCAPVMVMPTMSKNLESLPEIAVMWQAARKAISDAETIVLFGFSLPQSDALLAGMIRKSICTGRKLRSVAAIDLYPDPILERFSQCVPDDMTVTAFPFPVVSGETPSWLRKVA